MNSDSTNPPADLPVPVDDGATARLLGMNLPRVNLKCTDGTEVDLSALGGTCVIYIYPMTGRPDVPLPDGWHSIPGATGCTPQACSFRDHHAELQELDSGVYGLSTQDSDYQKEARDRLNLPFQLLSDSQLQLKSLLRLPTFKVNELELYKRLTLIIRKNRIVKVFYPVFPPENNADDVLEWLRKHTK